MRKAQGVVTSACEGGKCVLRKTDGRETRERGATFARRNSGFGQEIMLLRTHLKKGKVRRGDIAGERGAGTRRVE